MFGIDCFYGYNVSYGNLVLLTLSDHLIGAGAGFEDKAEIFSKE
jgi:hypothetical protein